MGVVDGDGELLKGFEYEPAIVKDRISRGFYEQKIGKFELQWHDI